MIVLRRLGKRLMTAIRSKRSKQQIYSATLTYEAGHRVNPNLILANVRRSIAILAGNAILSLQRGQRINLAMSRSFKFDNKIATCRRIVSSVNSPNLNASEVSTLMDELTNVCRTTREIMLHSGNVEFRSLSYDFVSYLDQLSQEKRALQDGHVDYSQQSSMDSHNETSIRNHPRY